MRERKFNDAECEQYREHYSEDQFWRKVGEFPRDAGRAVVEKAVSLYVILTDRDTPMWARALIVGALGYFICPLDAIPDFLPVIGFLDDAAVLAWVVSRVRRDLDEFLAWEAGEGPVIDVEPVAEVAVDPVLVPGGAFIFDGDADSVVRWGKGADVLWAVGDDRPRARRRDWRTLEGRPGTPWVGEPLAAPYRR